MNYRDKTKAELIIELQKLHLEYEELKTSYEKGITEHKKALEKIKENTGKLRTLFETMSEGVALNEIVYKDKGEMVDYRII